LTSPENIDSYYDTLIIAALASGRVSEAQQLAYQWLNIYATNLSSSPSRRELRRPLLWQSIGQVVEQTSDHYLIECLWQILDKINVQAQSFKSLPMLGIPILNRVDLLSRLLDSLDVPVDCLAIVDNSHLPDQQNPSSDISEVTRFLAALQQLGHPLIDQIHIARPFRNLGVAASWNHILTSFPEKQLTLIANNDVVFSPGVIGKALDSLDANRAQFLSLFPPPHAFSAFLLTNLCWDRVGLFDSQFHNAYFEDLEFRDRMRACPDVEQVSADFSYQEMLRLNPEHSSTIGSEPRLAEWNKISYSLNKLWYLSPRRWQHDRRGTWRRLWLSQWSEL
jgi:hypothetical protein